jgi:hypothetical protein
LNPTLRAVTAVIVIASPAAFAASFATSFSEKDDPARWYQPLETSQQKYDNAKLEARNALAEALRECRASAERKSCEAAARAQYQREVSKAKAAFLAPTRQLG